MSDLMAKCDWRDSTLFLVLSDDPERIGVRLFDSRHAPSRIYVPMAEVERLQSENAKLRKLVADLWEGYVPPCEDCPFKDYPSCADCPICARETAVVDRMRELGIEVDG